MAQVRKPRTIKDLEKELKPFPIASIDNVFKHKIDDTIGVVADTHFGSKYMALPQLEQIYDHFEERGVKQVYHAGDLVDGIQVYKGQFNDQNKIGYDQQAEEVIKRYPKKKNIDTFMIMGNHDASFMVREGADIVKHISQNRPDLKYTGMYYARFKDPSGLKMDLVHPSGASPYALSYGAQKYLRNRPPSYHPDILLNGHRHSSFYGYIQEVHSVEAGSFMEPTDFLVRMGCSGNIGGWVLEMDRDGDFVKRMRPEWNGFKTEHTRRRRN